MFKTLLLTTSLVALVCVLACGDDPGDPIAAKPPPGGGTPLTKDDSVIANCYIVRDAAEAYAAANNGVYAYDPWGDPLPDGRTLVDFLPEGKLLVNPHTGRRTQPTPGMAVYPGDTSYVGRYDTPPHGYVILGKGSDWTIILQLYTDFFEPLGLEDR